MKINRFDPRYKLAERIIHLETALATANFVLNEQGLLGVIPQTGISFRKASTFHKKVRKLLKNH